MVHFSILLTTYNRPTLLLHTLKSFSLQTYKHFTIYLLDNGSEPPVDLSNLPKDLDIVYIRIDVNHMNSEPHNNALNYILSNCQQEFSQTQRKDVFINFADDDVLLPGALAVVADCFSNHPKLDNLSIGFSKFDHETGIPLSTRGYFNQFSGKLHEFDGFRAGLEHCRGWGIGKSVSNKFLVPRLAHSSGGFFSTDLIRRTLDRQKELFVPPIGDCGFVGTSFNSKNLYYLDAPYLVLGESRKKEMDGAKAGNRHHWRELSQYLEFSPLKGCSFTNMGLDSSLKVLHRNGINRFVDVSIRPDFFLRHMQSILSDDPWTEETDRDLKEAIPFAVQSLREHKSYSKKEAQSRVENWIEQQLKGKETRQNTNNEDSPSESVEKQADLFKDINEFAIWQEKSFITTEMKPFQNKFHYGKNADTINQISLSNDTKESEIPISFSLNVYNEEDRISHVLESCIQWADEIIVFNKSSTDRTKEICLQFGEKVKVIDIPFSPPDKSDTIAQAKIPVNDWIFYGTASEIPTRDLIRVIKQILRNSKGSLDLIYVPRKYYSFGIHDKRSPWSISYFPFLINRKKTIISNTIHKNFRPSDPKNTAKIEYSDECCVYHLTHTSVNSYLHSMTDYFTSEAEACENPAAKIEECMANISKYEKQLGNSGNELLGHYFAWQIYWLGTALSVWEKWRGIDIKRYYQQLRKQVVDREWIEGRTDDTLHMKNDAPPTDQTYERPLVSAIVSTCNSERFIRGCLEDLESQTIRDRLEIIVVDSGSKQNEAAIVKAFQEKFSNIKYLKTEERETVYAAWNRGIKAASGKYITNANTDDRHVPYAFERMVHVLETDPEISLVYADVWITEKENETFENFTLSSIYRWQDFDPRTLTSGCYIGPQPMWRKNVHEEHGYFDETFHSAGDWEFWLRISKTKKFLHLTEPLGLYLKSPTSVEHRDLELSREEARRIHRQYGSRNGESASDAERLHQSAQLLMKNGKKKEAIAALLKLLNAHPDFAMAHNDLGVLYLKDNENETALKHYKRAVEIEPGNPIFYKNLADLYYVRLGLAEEALEIYIKLLTAYPKDVEILMAIGHICIGLGKLDEAKDFLNRILEYDPCNEDAKTIIGALVKKQEMESSDQISVDSAQKANGSIIESYERMHKDEPKLPNAAAG